MSRHVSLRLIKEKYWYIHSRLQNIGLFPKLFNARFDRHLLGGRHCSWKNFDILNFPPFDTAVQPDSGAL